MLRINLDRQIYSGAPASVRKLLSRDYWYIYEASADNRQHQAPTAKGRHHCRASTAAPGASTA